MKLSHAMMALSLMGSVWAEPVQLCKGLIKLEIAGAKEAVDSNHESERIELKDGTTCEVTAILDETECYRLYNHQQSDLLRDLTDDNNIKRIEFLDQGTNKNVSFLTARLDGSDQGKTRTFFARYTLWRNPDSRVGCPAIRCVAGSEKKVPTTTFSLTSIGTPAQLAHFHATDLTGRNLKNLSTALEMYCSDHEGRYPTDLAELSTGGYMNILPTCPVTHQPYRYQSSQKPDAFRLSSPGDPLGVGDGFPAYDSEQGLLEHK